MHVGKFKEFLSFLKNTIIIVRIFGKTLLQADACNRFSGFKFKDV